MKITDKKITMRITGNTTMVGVNVNELRRAYGATEAARICVSCDAPFFPKTETDTCSRCAQRQSDRLAGAKLTAWVMAALFFTLLALASRMHGASVVTEKFLDGIAQRESRNNPAAVGRHGELGAYQIRPCAVQEINTKMGWNYSHRVAAVKFGRVYAKIYCHYLEGKLTTWLGRSPTQPEVYNAYRLGPSGYIRAARRTSKSNQPSAVRSAGEFRTICAVARAFDAAEGAGTAVPHGRRKPHAVGWPRGDAFPMDHACGLRRGLTTEAFSWGGCCAEVVRKCPEPC